MLKISNIFKRSKEVRMTVYLAVINGDEFSFPSKTAMFAYIEEFGKSNVINSLSMFKNVIYSIV